LIRCRLLEGNACRGAVNEFQEKYEFSTAFAACGNRSGRVAAKKTPDQCCPLARGYSKSSAKTGDGIATTMSYLSRFDDGNFADVNEVVSTTRRAKSGGSKEILTNLRSCASPQERNYPRAHGAMGVAIRWYSRAVRGTPRSPPPKKAVEMDFSGSETDWTTILFSRFQIPLVPHGAQLRGDTESNLTLRLATAERKVRRRDENGFPARLS